MLLGRLLAKIAEDNPLRKRSIFVYCLKFITETVKMWAGKIAVAFFLIATTSAQVPSLGWCPDYQVKLSFFYAKKSKTKLCGIEVVFSSLFFVYDYRLNINILI